MKFILSMLLFVASNSFAENFVDRTELLSRPFVAVTEMSLVSLSCNSLDIQINGVLNQDENNEVQGNIMITSALLKGNNEIAMSGDIKLIPAGSLYKEDTKVLTLKGEKDSSKIVFRMINKAGSLFINGVPQMPIKDGFRKAIACD